jgi:regulatory protein
MVKPRRAGKGKGWGGNKQAGRKSKEGSPDLPVLGAVVISIEAHPKQPNMYRVALKLELDKSNLLTLNQANDELAETERQSIDWTEEVDALIAGAHSVAEEGEALLTVHEDTLVSWRLLKGRELTANEYAKLKEDEQKEDAYRSALMMLERKARTTAELSKLLKRKEYVPDVVAGCLERLQARGMLDDSAYAKRFTEQRAVGQRKGRMLIKQELLQRGVGREDADQAIGELDGQIEQESALELTRKRCPTIKGNDRERKQKLTALLMRRGFPSAIVRLAIKHIAAESEIKDFESDYDDGDPFNSEFLDD